MTAETSPMRQGAAIVGLVCQSGAEAGPVLARLVERLARRGIMCAGLLQHDTVRPGRTRCDMSLLDLASGAVIAISEDRGAGARGCHLHEGRLLEAMELARVSLAAGPSLLVLNKFGKAEAAGGGLRPLIVEAIERKVPVLAAVPRRNIEGWRSFVDELSAECEIEDVSWDDTLLLRALGIEPETADRDMRSEIERCAP